MRNRGRLSDFETLRNQMMNFFNEFEQAGRVGAGVFPAMNIREDSENLYLTAELPGIAADEVDLTIEKDHLTIRGERKIPVQDKKVAFHRRERESGIFRRVVSLPVAINAEAASAVTSNGILEITLPKAAEAKPRAITVLSK